ncbi:hypothetical protein GH754_11755 [Salinibacillus xinjiangensis]|uniref:NTP pyrophosphohydrolase MazG putative catalytic core domain-containing protein n=2 Tax=Salinibacillus xinjiangensis TaxID=1229268 RepID=A0A6G1X7K4_9BACI|nr:hypothetical protein [Salinibacillus xinjiangensis]
MHQVNKAVFEERERQNEKWGRQKHSYLRWYTILGEEVGEVAEALQQDMVNAKSTDADDLYKELIQVAAVASAFAEQVKSESKR